MAVNHPKTSKFNKAFEFSMISLYYSHNIHNNMFFFKSHYPDFLITPRIYVLENYVLSIVLYGLWTIINGKEQPQSTDIWYRSDDVIQGIKML